MNFKPNVKFAMSAIQNEEPQAAPQPTWERVPITAHIDGVIAPLTITGGCVLPSNERYEHCEQAIQAAARLGIPVLVGPSRVIITKPCVLVGTGPSAIPLLEEIRERYARGEQVIAIKGAHDWLVKNGVKPAAAIAADPQQSRAKCFKRLQDGTLYMCASQMHPDTWEHLRGRRTLIWHAQIGVEQRQRPGWENAFLVPHSSTSGNSALDLLYIMGRRNLELYGFDSSLPPVTSPWQRFVKAAGARRLIKLDGSRVPRDKRIVTVTIDGQTFETTTELVQQAQELQVILQSMPGVKVNAHGHGYYQAVLAAGKARGWPV